MLMIYISHPYTGNEAENVESAAEITDKLAHEFPNMMFLNPLAIFAHMADMPYETVMAQAIELLGICDGVIMCDGWRVSVGCEREYNEAKRSAISIYQGVADFREIMKEEAANVTCPVCGADIRIVGCGGGGDDAEESGKRYMSGKCEKCGFLVEGLVSKERLAVLKL